MSANVTALSWSKQAAKRNLDTSEANCCSTGRHHSPSVGPELTFFAPFLGAMARSSLFSSALFRPRSLLLTLSSPLSRSGWSYQPEHNPSFQTFKGSCLSLNVLRFKQVALQALSKTALLQRKERRKERSTRFDFIYYAILYEVKYSELTQKQCWVISSRFRILSEGGCVVRGLVSKSLKIMFLFQIICFLVLTQRVCCSE